MFFLAEQGKKIINMKEPNCFEGGRVDFIDLNVTYYTY